MGRTSKGPSINDRIEVSPNAQVCRYLKEWLDNAVQRNDRLQFVYRKALNSLLELDTPIVRFQDLEKLHGIGPNIRSRLEKRCRDDGILLEGVKPAPEAANSDNSRANEGDATIDATTFAERPKKRRKANVEGKEYIPAFRSGPYAMLIALYLEQLDPRSRGYLLKQEIISSGQPYCSLPMDEGTFSPINGAIKTLVAKGLVERSSIPARFSLTSQGGELAERLWISGEKRSSAPLPSVLDDVGENEEQSIEPPLEIHEGESRFETFTLLPDQYDIILLVDTREMKSRDEREFLVTRLNDAGITAEQRSLELGDFLWIARAKPGISVPDEVVLDYVIERKREDDLIASISDGRFIEQKVLPPYTQH